MKSIPRLCIILSLTMLAAARPAVSDRAIRVPLERRSRNARDLISTQSVTGGQFLGADRVQGLVNSTHRKYASTFAAYERHTGSRHPLDTFSRSSSTSPSRPTGSGGEQLTDYRSIMWYGRVDFGTPPQTFEMDFDTGSADPWIPGEACLVTCDGHNTYHADQSTTVHDERDTNIDPIVYGSGEVLVGTVYTDVVAVAGVTLPNQEFGVVGALSPDFWRSLGPLGEQFPADGIFGLGFSAISELGITPPVESLRKRSDLPQGFLSFRLSDVRGELIIGDADYGAFKTNTLVYTPLNGEGYWQIFLGKISRSGSSVITAINAPAIVDTGTTLIMVPTNIADEYFSNFDGADCSGGICTVPCNTIDSTRPTLTFGGKNFEVCPSTWNFGPVGGVSENCYTGMGASSEFNFVIVGDVFLRNVYSIFDFRSLRVGFADLEEPVC